MLFSLTHSELRCRKISISPVVCKLMTRKIGKHVFEKLRNMSSYRRPYTSIPLSAIAGCENLQVEATAVHKRMNELFTLQAAAVQWERIMNSVWLKIASLGRRNIEKSQAGSREKDLELAHKESSQG